MNTRFEVNDPVWSPLWGKGTVIEVREGANYPIIVHFDKLRGNHGFTYEGIWLTDDAAPVLFPASMEHEYLMLCE